MTLRALVASFVSMIALASLVVAEGPDYWAPGRDWSLEADPTFQLRYDRGAAPWSVGLQQGQVVHLLFEFPLRILRYDMSAESWLPFIPLSASPTAMAIDSNGIYVAFGAEVHSFALDGSGETTLHTAAFSVDEMLVGGDFLFLAATNEMEVIDRVSGDLIDSASYFYSMRGLSIAPSIRTIYARTVGVGPSDILSISYAADGTLGGQSDSPYHGAYPGAVQTWVFANEQRVADNSGVVYTTGLGYGGSLAGPFDDLAFHGSDAIALRGTDLYRHDANLLETGRIALTEAVRSIFVWDQSVFGFFSSVNGADVVKVAMTSIVPPEPGPPVDPDGLMYEPDQIVASGDLVYLLSKDDLSVFRWSEASESYLETIPLTEAPSFMAYSTLGQRLYLSYPSGRITVIDLSSDGPFQEVSFVNSPQQPCGLSIADPYVFVCDPSGAWVSHFTYAPDGSLLSREEWNYYSFEYVWSAANGKMYFLRDDTSPKDILWEEIDVAGVLGTKIDSPLHSSEGMTHPIRVHSNGSIVILGSGRFHNASSLELLDELGTAFVDGQWLGHRLVTLHPAGDDSELLYWNDFLATTIKTEPLNGAPIRLVVTGKGLVAVTETDGIPRFTVIETPLFTDGFESGDTMAWSLTSG